MNPNDFVEKQILEAVSKCEESTDAMASLTTVLVTIAITSGFTKKMAMEAFEMQWDRLEEKVTSYLNGA
jgi:hypothetical protein